MPVQPKPEPNIVKAWKSQNTLLEFYCYTPGQPEKLPAHCHDQYQFCLSVNYPSEYYYRQSVHFVPIGSLSVIHPGEMHSGTGRDVGDRQIRATFRMMYVEPSVIRRVAKELLQQDNLPFPNSIILDPGLARLFLRFHQASQRMASQLEQDERLQAFLAPLIRYADSRLADVPIGQEREAVRQVRDCLRDRYAENVTLKQLAELVNFSPYYLSRVFRSEVGVSLTHYQNQVRINQARSLLIEGMTIKQVAAKTGFVDQSHLTHTFKHFVQVTPGKYCSKERKNLQDFLD